jgi:proteasome regulatory subunit
MFEDTRYKIDMEEISVNTTAPSTELKHQLQLNDLEASLLEMKVKVDELIKENAQLRGRTTSLSACRCLLLLS